MILQSWVESLIQKQKSLSIQYQQTIWKTWQKDMKNLVEVNGIDIEKKILEKHRTKIGIITFLNVFVRPYLILLLLSKHEQNQHIYRRQVQLFFKRTFYCLFVIQKLFGKAYQNRSNYNYLRIQNSFFLSYKMIRHYLRLYVKKMIHFSNILSIIIVKSWIEILCQY